MSKVKIAAKMVADMMQGHYENPIECVYEFFMEDDFEDIAKTCDCSVEDVAEAVEYIHDIDDLYSERTLEFRKQVLEEVRKNLNL